MGVKKQKDGGGGMKEKREGERSTGNSERERDGGRRKDEFNRTYNSNNSL